MFAGCVSVLVLCAGCGARSLTRERGALLELHAAQRRAHLARDADALVALLADELVQVQDGAVSHRSRAQSLTRFRAYFGAVEFLAWDDLEPPRIHLAPGGDLATVVVRKLVRLRTRGEDGQPTIERSVFAWLATCERRGGRWLITQLASTREPEGVAATLAAAERALGGSAAVRRVRAIHAVAQGQSPSGAYRLELTARRGRSVRMGWRFPGKAPFSAIVEGDRGWSASAGTDAREALPPAEVATVRAHAFPLIPLALDEFFTSPSSGGTERFHDRSCARLTLRDELGQEVRAYFDLETDLLFGLVLADPRGTAGDRIEVELSNWQAAGDVKVPMEVRIRDRKGHWRLVLGDVRVER